MHFTIEDFHTRSKKVT